MIPSEDYTSGKAVNVIGFSCYRYLDCNSYSFFFLSLFVCLFGGGVFEFLLSFG